MHNTEATAAIIRTLKESVKRNLSDGILLSGGLDTSILTALAAKWSRPECITVALKGAPAPDIEYAVEVAGIFKLDHEIHYFQDDELEEGLRKTIEILKTFDPMEVRNSAAAYIAFKTAREKGLKTVMTGDAGDELFAGYSFFFNMTAGELDTALKNLWSNMNFSSIRLAGSLGLEARLPLLDPEFTALAMSLDSGLKVKKDRGQVWGKWVLRKAFEDLLPSGIIWRVKAPLEIGTGTTTLPEVFNSRIADSEFSRKKQFYLKEDGVNIRSKEHLVYYEIYRKLYGRPDSKIETGKQCPGCRAAVKEETNFCRTCGAYPI